MNDEELVIIGQSSDTFTHLGCRVEVMGVYNRRSHLHSQFITLSTTKEQQVKDEAELEAQRVMHAFRRKRRLS